MTEVMTLNGVLFAILLFVLSAAMATIGARYLRDSLGSARHHATRNVWCPIRQRRALVDFAERIQGGTVVRHVERCTLLYDGETCDGACRNQANLRPLV